MLSVPGAGLRPARRFPVSQPLRNRQEGGFIIIVALVALVIMTLAAIGLMRTVSTSATLAGNLGFEQAATSSADQAIEAAIVWLENNNGKSTSATAVTCATGSTVLACDQTARGYAATRTDPASTQTWATLWSTLAGAGYTAVTLSTDAAGNTPAYLIQRMCNAAGDASSATGCSVSPLSLDTTSSHKSGFAMPATSTQVYYRIMVRVSGPRSTTSFVHAMVAL